MRGAGVLTAAVLGHPADGGRQTVDVEVLAVEVRALLLPEVPASLRTRFRVARAELHPATHAEPAAVTGPVGRLGGG